ncbi:MAG TPA: DNA translocase FtsK [Candidatus Eubacterium pullicola]|nr:DNA translocase FtsK [Candidatus Eubacterium pullicola]
MATKKTGKSSAAGAKGSRSRSKSGKAASSKKNIKSVDENAKRLYDEIAAIIMLVVGIFLAIAMHTHLAGIIGEGINSFLKGVFGLGGFVLPYFLIIFSAMMFAKVSKPFKGRTVIFLIIIFLMIDILNAGRFVADFDISATSIGEVYHNGTLLRSGGVAGMYLGYLVAKGVGIPGLYLFSFAVIIIFLLLTVNTPISRAYEKAKERKAAKKERAAKRAEMLQDIEAEEIEKIDESQVDFLEYLKSTPEDRKRDNISKKNKKHIMDLLKNDDKYGLKDSRTNKNDNKESDIKDYIPAAAVTAAAVAVSDNSDNTVDKDKTSQEASLETIEIEDFKTSASGYTLPPVELLKQGKTSSKKSNENLAENARLLEETLKSFNVEAKVVNVTKGSSVTRYEIQPAIGVKVSRIVSLSDDIALNLRARSIRIEAPIPGKAAVGIEVENETRETVTIREMIDSREFKREASKLAFAVGKDISGRPVVADLAKMPHLLIAGATGSGKSVCINTIIASILYRATPDEVRLIMVDPKMVELGNYNGIPHLLIPVVTDPNKAAAALNWAVAEMTNRYKKFAENNVRDLKSYNALMKREKKSEEIMPQIVIIIDELADLMMVASSQVEQAISRLTQLARAAGMHLIVATQRPSVDVVTGLIKANIPSRIAFMVSSQIDSRTIIDMAGAEKLVGNGDMLYKPQDIDKPLRIQGPYISDDEVMNLIRFVKSQIEDENYDSEIAETIEKGDVSVASNDQEDELMDEAIMTVIDAGQASVSMLQRKFRIGYNRAARIIEDMQSLGVIGPPDGSRPRSVLWSIEDYNTKRQSTEEI